MKQVGVALMLCAYSLEVLGLNLGPHWWYIISYACWNEFHDCTMNMFRLLSNSYPLTINDPLFILFDTFAKLGGGEWSPTGSTRHVGHWLAYCSLPRVIMMMENLVEWRMAGETEVLWENLPQRHFVHHKSYLTRPGLEPGPSRWEAGDQPLELWRSLFGTALLSYVRFSECSLVPNKCLCGHKDPRMRTVESGTKRRISCELKDGKTQLARWRSEMFCLLVDSGGYAEK
jgi:hypothetical protein